MFRLSFSAFSLEQIRIVFSTFAKNVRHKFIGVNFHKFSRLSSQVKKENEKGKFESFSQAIKLNVEAAFRRLHFRPFNILPRALMKPYDDTSTRSFCSTAQKRKPKRK
jgi:hypothetical protein